MQSCERKKYFMDEIERSRRAFYVEQNGLNSAIDLKLAHSGVTITRCGMSVGPRQTR